MADTERTSGMAAAEVSSYREVVASAASMYPEAPPPRLYAVSEALPLHRLGLVPPPPELGPHLDAQSALAVALAAANLTAETMAVPPLPLAPPDPPATGAPDADGALEIAAGAETAPPAAMDETAGMVAGGSGAQAAAVTGPAESIAEPGTAPAAIAAAAAAADGPGLAALDLTRRAGGATGVSSFPPASPAAAQTAENALSIAHAEHGAALAPPLDPAAAAWRPNAVKPPRPPAPPMRTARPLPARVDAGPVSNWPGYAAGVAMAIVIGAGLYFSLVVG